MRAPSKTAFQFGAVPEEGYLKFRIVSNGKERSGDSDIRGEIAAHRVERNGDHENKSSETRSVNVDGDAALVSTAGTAHHMWKLDRAAVRADRLGSRFQLHVRGTAATGLVAWGISLWDRHENSSLWETHVSAVQARTLGLELVIVIDFLIALCC